MKAESKRHVCPFCDEEVVEAAYPFCQSCRVELLRCPTCARVLPRETSQCPGCGTKISTKQSDKGK